MARLVRRGRDQVLGLVWSLDFSPSSWPGLNFFRVIEAGFNSRACLSHFSYVRQVGTSWGMKIWTYSGQRTKQAVCGAAGRPHNCSQLMQWRRESSSELKHESRWAKKFPQLTTVCEKFWKTPSLVARLRSLSRFAFRSNFLLSTCITICAPRIIVSSSLSNLGTFKHSLLL